MCPLEISILLLSILGGRLVRLCLFSWGAGSCLAIRSSALSGLMITSRFLKNAILFNFDRTLCFCADEVLAILSLLVEKHLICSFIGLIEFTSSIFIAVINMFLLSLKEPMTVSFEIIQSPHTFSSIIWYFLIVKRSIFQFECILGSI